MPKPKTPHLTPFEGQEVVAVGLIVTSLGDGLSDAVAVAPDELHHGQRIKLLVDAEVTKVRFDPVKDTNVLTRIHIAKASTAALVEESAVAAIMERHAAALDEIRGTPQLDLAGGDPGDALGSGDDPDEFMDPEPPRPLTDEERAEQGDD